MESMSKDVREAFLAEVHVGVIAVERQDRAPFAVPIWYAYEPGGQVSIWTQQGTLKAKLIRAAGRFSITVQDEQPPYRYVTAEGDVSVVEPAEKAEVLAIATRYLGEEEGSAFVGQVFADTSVIIRMKPSRWLSQGS